MRNMMANSLMKDLVEKGVSLFVQDNRLRYRAPKGAMTPQLQVAVTENKEAILQAVRRHASAASEPADTAKIAQIDTLDSQSPQWEDCIEPPPPCLKCGHMDAWWDVLGEVHCIKCEPPPSAMRLLKAAERIRRRQGLPSPPEAATLVFLMKAYL